MNVQAPPDKDLDPSILERQQVDGIATLTLNRPKQFNALSEEMLSALQAALDDIGRDPEIRVVVLAAKGRGFCGGHDLKQMRAKPDRAYYQRLFETCSRMMLSLIRIPQPVIAKVQGMATAAGCQLVATCDLAVAAETASFATSGINVGLFCATPGVALSRNLSRKRAFEMLMTGEFIDAATAEEFGLVNHVVPAGQLDEAVDRLARKIMGKSAVAVSAGKRLFYSQLEKGLDDAYREAAEVMACNMMAEDAGEGIDAFMEKRPAVWRNR